MQYEYENIQNTAHNFSFLLITSCSEDKMDEINKDVNNALTMSAQSELPDVILKSAL